MSNTATRLAINGFGRIGRSAFKIALQKPNAQIVAVNDLTNPVILAHLLQYDTTYGKFDHTVSVELDGREILLDAFRGKPDFYTQPSTEAFIVIDKKHKIQVFSQKDPSALPWQKLDIDVVLECTGFFTEDDSAQAHITAGAKKVIISAPTSGGETKTFVIGVNADSSKGEKLVSNASCTTNCTSPVVAVLHSKFTVVKAGLTTIHAVTAGQNLVDGPPSPRKPDIRTARAAGWNIIPSSTGAAKATTKTLPALEGLFDGIAVRVPVISGSLIDVTALVAKKTTVEEVNQAFIDASQNLMYTNVMTATYEPLVSSDIVGTTYSAIVDLNMTRVIDGDLVKILAWYDNEWGYSHRLVEIALL